MHLVTESRVSDGVGNSIVVWRVDARAQAIREPAATLVKCGRPEHAMRNLRTIRISKPAHFRKYGEGLVRDPSEGAASDTVITEKRIDDPDDLREDQVFLDEVGKCAESIGESIRMTAKSTKRTTERGTRIQFGRNCWIYSTALEPTSDEQWNRLRDALEPEYKHTDYIHRPSQFAWSLGLMVVEQLGPQGSEQTSTDSFGEKVVETRSPMQLIVHGPVVYVTDPFRVINSAQTNTERVLLPIFVKHERFADQREYRFVIWTDEEPSKSVVDLNISCAMLGSLEERQPALASLPPVERAMERVSKPAEPPEVADEPDRSAGNYGLLDSTSDWFWPGLLGRKDNPATPLSRTIDPADYAVDPRAATTVAALSALRSKVAEVRGERRVKAASSAWHAEPWISHLCKRFVDPIGGISITDDDILVVSLKFPKGVDTTAKMCFGPSGAYVNAVKGAREQSISHSLSPDVHAIPSGLWRSLSRLGMVPCWELGDGSK